MGKRKLFRGVLMDVSEIEAIKAAESAGTIVEVTDEEVEATEFTPLAPDPTAPDDGVEVKSTEEFVEAVVEAGGVPSDSSEPAATAAGAEGEGEAVSNDAGDTADEPFEPVEADLVDDIVEVATETASFDEDEDGA